MQYEIEKIEKLDKLCRRLNILYLQGNVIGKLGTPSHNPSYASSSRGRHATGDRLAFGASGGVGGSQPDLEPQPTQLGPKAAEPDDPSQPSATHGCQWRASACSLPAVPFLGLICAAVCFAENLSRLRELQYLNMTLNNVKKIEGLDQNEALEKLDMTCNFVKDPLCLENLKAPSKP